MAPGESFTNSLTQATESRLSDAISKVVDIRDPTRTRQRHITGRDDHWWVHRMCVGPGFDQVTGRGMITQATNDTYGTPERIARLAERTGARVAPLEGCGHWWMLDNPAGAAALITDFWG